MYIYRHKLYKSTNGLNDAGFNDFKTNNKPSATKVDGVVIAQTAFITDFETYAEFDAIIVNPYLWSDVRYVALNNLTYDLYLTTESPI